MPQTEQTLAIRAGTGSLLDQETDAVIVPLVSGEAPQASGAAVDRALDGLSGEMRERGEFKGELFETALFPTLGRLRAGRLLLLGMGKRRDLGLSGWQRAVSAACRSLASRQVGRATLDLRACGLPAADAGRAAAEGAELALYDADPYRTQPRKERMLAELALLGGETIEEPMREGRILGRAKNLARELVNEPGNVLTPGELARRATETAAEVGLECQVLD